MKKMFSSLAVVFLMSANAFAQNIPMDPSVKTGTLPTG
jgi:zinc protease